MKFKPFRLAEVSKQGQELRSKLEELETEADSINRILYMKAPVFWRGRLAGNQVLSRLFRDGRTEDSFYLSDIEPLEEALRMLDQMEEAWREQVNIEVTRDEGEVPTLVLKFTLPEKK